ncbi:MAG: LamG-like jellyroll fold domain-containing protein [Phycisphaeraceae bacterium]
MLRSRFSSYAAAVVLSAFLLTPSTKAALVAYYPFDIAPGGISPDVAGGNDATLQNGASIVASPAPNGVGGTGSLMLDGTNDQALAIGFKGVTGGTSRTLMAWVNTSTATDDGIMAWGTNATGEKWVVRINDNAGNGPLGALRVEVNGGFQIGNVSLVDGNWHHIAVMLDDDGTPNVNELQFFVDGSRHAIGGNLGTLINTAIGADVSIGNDPITNATRNFPGMIDEVRIHNSTVRTSEITQAFNGKALPIAALSYNATNDTDNNAVWEDEVRLYAVGNRDFNLTGQSRVGVVGNIGLTHAYAFDGSGGITTTVNNPENFANNVTDNSASFELWFKPADLQGQEVLWEWGGATDGTSFTLNGSAIQFAVNDDNASGNVGLSSSLSGVPGHIQVVGVVDLDNDIVQLYVNGELAGGVFFDGIDWAGSDATGLASQFGGAVGGHNGFFGALNGYNNFTGQIAIVRLYTEALNAEEVRALYLENAFIPEPATLSLLLLAGGALARRRRAGA